MKKLLMMTMALFFGLGVAACNTVEGMGRDIESGGEAIQEGSQELNN